MFSNFFKNYFVYEITWNGGDGQAIDDIIWLCMLGN